MIFDIIFFILENILFERIDLIHIKENIDWIPPLYERSRKFFLAGLRATIT